MLDSLKNNTIIRKIFNERLLKLLIYLGFAYVMWTKHIPLYYTSDDKVVASMVHGYSLKDWFHYLIYFNGRIMTDFFSNVWYRIGMETWKQFDSCVYALAAMLFTRVFTKNRWYDALACCVLINFFPLFYFSSAGYIACTTNYFYPIVCILFILLYIKYILEDKKIPLLLYPVVLVSIIYGTNHDQTGIALLAGLFCYIIYCKITKAEKRLINHLIGLFSVSFVVYMIYFLLPGHLGRITGSSISELYWYPEFANWTLLDKIYHGYATTAANLIYNDVFVFTIFAIMLIVVSLRQKCPAKMIVGFIPFAGILISHYLGNTQFIAYPPLTYGMTEMMEMKWFILPMLLSVLVVVCVFLGLWFNIKDEKNRLFTILLLLLGCGTRLMMGFTPTIYASSYRTFTFFLYALIACILIMLNDLEDDKEHKYLWYMGIAAVFSLATL